MRISDEEARAVGTVAINEMGSAQLEFFRQKERRIAQWERVNGAVLESIFDGNGAILRQIMHKDEPGKTSALLEQFVNKEKVFIMGEREFSEVKLKKNCPTCGKEGLKREISNVPVMPIYVCGMCSNKSYHLTDDYLSYLVDNNPGLFNEKELQEMRKDKGAFNTQLKEYVIRIFASKKIACIK